MTLLHGSTLLTAYAVARDFCNGKFPSCSSQAAREWYRLRRIRAACDYLTDHPDAVCVASGGQNDREPDTEARCIRDTLVSMGIDQARIRTEERSQSTEENLAFSAAVIREEGMSTAVVIASDNFHQLRAAIWAEREGLAPYAAGCASPWFLTAGYWAREAAALLYMVCTGM